MKMVHHEAVTGGGSSSLSAQRRCKDKDVYTYHYKIGHYIWNFLTLKLQLSEDNLRSSENTRETRQKEGEKGERVDDGPMTGGFYDGC